jgi:putative FmdB family regulatory protein
VPKYCYKCKECDHEFEVRHGIKEKLYDCKNCDNSESLYRIPQLTRIVKTPDVGKQKTGSLVKEYIEENKRILEEEKKQRIEYDN